MYIKEKIIYYIGNLAYKLLSCADRYMIIKAEKSSGCKINYINQGITSIEITNPQNFSISETSHLKSNTFIECEGKVEIGRYFHVGRGLTIFSANHNYGSDKSIPYDYESILKSVKIGDFVWCGSNVTILPGVSIGEGVVIGAGSVVTKDVPDYAIVAGNPAKIIKYRDIDKFLKLKSQGKFY